MRRIKKNLSAKIRTEMKQQKDYNTAWILEDSEKGYVYEFNNAISETIIHWTTRKEEAMKFVEKNEADHYAELLSKNRREKIDLTVVRI